VFPDLLSFKGKQACDISDFLNLNLDEASDFNGIVLPKNQA
jgi:hypothetical protein